MGNETTKYKFLWDAYYDFAYIWTAQIYYNTNYKDIAQQFKKYVDDTFNLLVDHAVFQDVKNKANAKLMQIFKASNNAQPQRQTIRASPDNKSVVTTAYRAIEPLFAANNHHQQQPHKPPPPRPNNKEFITQKTNLHRITSADTTNSECQPILNGNNDPYNIQQYGSLSPSVKSSSNTSNMNNDKISVISNHSMSNINISNNDNNASSKII